jgi:hypothetical protein
MTLAPTARHLRGGGGRAARDGGRAHDQGGPGPGPGAPRASSPPAQRAFCSALRNCSRPTIVHSFCVWWSVCTVRERRKILNRRPAGPRVGPPPGRGSPSSSRSCARRPLRATGRATRRARPSSEHGARGRTCQCAMARTGPSASRLGRRRRRCFMFGGLLSLMTSDRSEY